MQYQVPQFIEVEDKIVGPLTFPQFVYVAGGLGLCFVLYLYVPLLLAAPLILIVAGLAGALAFYKVNNKPFSDLIESAVRYALGSRLYIWKKELKKPQSSTEEAGRAPEQLFVPKLSESKLRDIAWSLDVHEERQRQTPADALNLEI